MVRSFRGAGVAAVVLAALVFGGGAARATIYVAGNFAWNFRLALDDLGEPFVRLSGSGSGGFPTPWDVTADDILIWGQDGGFFFPDDFTPLLDQGLDLILSGGSAFRWVPWTSEYFNNTDWTSGWHTDGDWTTTSRSNITAGLPKNYAFDEVGHTFHMQAFLPSPNTTLYGRNDEGQYVAAFREYANGGSFNYMALDLGDRPGDEAEFITPWLAGSLDAARNGLMLVPEPATASLLALGLSALCVARRRAQ